MLDVTCEHCGRALKIPEKYLGQRGKCSHCQGEITVTVASPKFSAEVCNKSGVRNEVLEAAGANCAARRVNVSDQMCGQLAEKIVKGLKQGLGMRKGVVVTLLIAVVILVGLPIVVSMRTESLETRANKWNDLLNSIKPGADHDSTIRKLCDFIEPSVTRLVRAEEYYQDLVNPAENRSRIVARSVDDVSFSESKNKAMVRYGLVVDSPDGERTQTVQTTWWEKKSGKWYRVQIMPDFPKLPPFPEFKPPPIPEFKPFPPPPPTPPWPSPRPPLLGGRKLK